MFAFLIKCKQVFCGALRKYGFSCVYNILFILLLLIALCTTIKSPYEAEQIEKSVQNSANNDAATYEMKSLKKEYGNSHTKEKHYAVVDITYPLFFDGSEAFKTNVNTYIQNYVIHNLPGDVSEDAIIATKIDILAQRFLNIDKKFVTDWPDIDQRWNITIHGEVVFTTPAVTSLALSIQSYAGGAHGYSEKTYISFNTETSTKIRLSDIISD